MSRYMALFIRRWYAMKPPCCFVSGSLWSKSQLQPDQYHATPAIARYFDHIQTRSSVQAVAQALSPAFSTVPFDFGSVPKIERKQVPPKKKEKTPKTVDQPVMGENTAMVANSQDNAGEHPKEKKEKKEKKKGVATVTPAEDGGKKNKGGAGGKAPAEDAGEPVPSMIDLRVGHIVDGIISSAFLSSLTVLHQ